MRHPDSWDAALAFVFAAAVALCLVPAAEMLARRIGAMDVPKERSLHDTPTPKLGGLAILVAVLGAGFIWLPLNDTTQAILAGAAAITLIGVIDDVFELPPAPKLLGQIAAALIPVVFGDVRVESLTLPFVGGVDLGWASYPLTVIGIVAVINIINFIDGVDGLASGVCAISAAAFAIIALSLDRYEAGVLAALTAGASLGFLRHGFPPASSFMGDTGSNLLGYLLATIAVQGSLKTNAVVALVLPLMVLAVPILDTGFVVAKRLKYRQPFYRADREHFHHRMARIGFSQRRTIAYLYSWTLVLAFVALGLRFVPYSDNHGHFNTGWTLLMAALLIGALAASLYIINVLEILKLRRVRWRQMVGLRGPAEPLPDQAAVDAGVQHEIETGEFKAVDPDTGEVAAVDPDTGEFEAVKPNESLSHLLAPPVDAAHDRPLPDSKRPRRLGVAQARHVHRGHRLAVVPGELSERVQDGTRLVGGLGIASRRSSGELIRSCFRRVGGGAAPLLAAKVAVPGVPQSLDQVAEVVVASQQAGAGKHLDVGLLNQVLSEVARSAQRARCPEERVDVVAGGLGVKLALLPLDRQ